MSQVYAGSWNGNLGNQTYWGLSRNVGPWKTTPVDQVRANSRPGKFYANAGAWFSSENPGPFIQTLPPSKRERYHDLDLVGKNDDFEAPGDMKVPRISGRGPKRAVGDKSTGVSRGGFAIGDVRAAEFGALGPGNDAQPARQQTRRPSETGPEAETVFPRNFKRNSTLDLFGGQNSRRASTVTSASVAASRRSSTMSAMDQVIAEVDRDVLSRAGRLVSGRKQIEDKTDVLARQLRNKLQAAAAAQSSAGSSRRSSESLFDFLMSEQGSGEKRRRSSVGGKGVSKKARTQ